MQQSAELSTSPRLQRRWLVMAAVAVLGSVVLLALALSHLRNQALQTAENLNTALVQLVAEQTTRTLQTVDQRLALTATSLVLMDGPNERNPETVARLLQSQLHGMPWVRSLWVLDLEDRIVYDSDAALAGADRTPAQRYGQTFAAQPNLSFTLTLPRPSAVPGTWLMQAASPLRDRAGTLTGSVVAVLDLHHLDTVWSGIDLGTEGTIVLLRRDGSMLLRVPYTESVMGKNFANLPVFRTLLPASNVGNYRAPGAADGVPRLFSYSTLTAHPDLVIIVGRSESHALARWWQWVSIVIWVWCTAAALMVAMGIALDKSWRRTAAAQGTALHSALRYQTLVHEAPDAIFAAAPNGQIIAANPASVALFGWTESEMQALGRAGLLDPSDTRLEHALKERSRTGQFRGELRFVRKNGETFEGELFSSVFSDQHGEQRSTIIVRDATERHRFENALQDSALKLQALSRRIINAQEAERRRVAHELHDELGQSLTAIKINLQSGARFKNRSPEQTNLENIRIVEDALQQVRTLALALRPSILDNLGLIPALSWLGKQVAQRADFVFDFVPPATVQRMAPELETTCFRIVQEALTNIVRHAKASHVSLSMQFAPDGLTVTLTDDGVGLDWSAVLATAQSGASAGVLGMLERADLVGGSLEVRSTPGAGCTFVLHCPLHLQPEQA